MPAISRSRQKVYTAIALTKYSAASSRYDVPGHLTRKLTSTPLGSPAAAQTNKLARAWKRRLRTSRGILRTTEKGKTMQRQTLPDWE